MNLTCVADATPSTTNARNCSSGPTGLGFTAGKAAESLTSTDVQPSDTEPSHDGFSGPPAVQVCNSNWRRAVNRFWPGSSRALAFARSNDCSPSRAMTTCLPSTAPEVLSQVVPSASSIRSPKFAPSPDAVAPLDCEAQFVGKWIEIVRLSFGEKSLTANRTWPYPGAMATKL